MAYLFEPDSGSMESEKSEDLSYERGSQTVRTDMEDPTQRSSIRSSSEKESIFSRINPFDKKKRCSECGTELEYREEYQSHYCPKCRTYK